MGFGQLFVPFYTPEYIQTESNWEFKSLSRQRWKTALRALAPWIQSSTQCDNHKGKVLNQLKSVLLSRR